jgi:hypothetical protein
MYVPGCGGGAAMGGAGSGGGGACWLTCHMPCVCGYAVGTAARVRGDPPACCHAMCYVGVICCIMGGPTGERIWRVGGGSRPNIDGRIVLWRPPVEPPIMFCLVACRLWAVPGLRQLMLVCPSSTSPPCVWQ